MPQRSRPTDATVTPTVSRSVGMPKERSIGVAPTDPEFPGCQQIVGNAGKVVPGQYAAEQID